MSDSGWNAKVRLRPVTAKKRDSEDDRLAQVPDCNLDNANRCRTKTFRVVVLCFFILQNPPRGGSVGVNRDIRRSTARNAARLPGAPCSRLGPRDHAGDIPQCRLRGAPRSLWL
jgi:hypothetical protein